MPFAQSDGASFLTTGEIQLASRTTRPGWARTTSSRGPLDGSDSPACRRRCRSTRFAKRTWRAWTKRWAARMGVGFVLIRGQGRNGTSWKSCEIVLTPNVVEMSSQIAPPLLPDWLKSSLLLHFGTLQATNTQHPPRLPRSQSTNAPLMSSNKINWNGKLNTFCPVAHFSGFRRTPPTAIRHLEANLTAEASFSTFPR